MSEKRVFKLASRGQDKPAVLYESDELPIWVVDQLETPVGKVRVASTALQRKDRVGGCMVRWGIRRFEYRVCPGLYAIGKPDSESEVLVTANYKLTFDMLRKELKGRNLWIVVLDTKGINVWCAAGKGTFGTAELINRIKKVQLEKVVTHRRIILPQLGAPGVAAHLVAKATGFKIIYGPVYASDLPAFMDAGMKAVPKMRQVKFDTYDRLVLTPIELVYSLKYVVAVYAVWVILNLPSLQNNSIVEVARMGIINAIPYFGAILVGAVLVPVLLPWIPFRAFSLKGALAGVVISVIAVAAADTFGYHGVLMYVGNTMLLTAITSFLALNFTGCTTFTSLSGVKLETKWTTIVAGIGGIIGLLLLMAESIRTLFG